MARSSSRIAPVAVVAALCVGAMWAAQNVFVTVPQEKIQLRGAQATAVAAAIAAPAAVQAADMSYDALDVGSSLNLAGTVEVLMLGLVMGTVPVTVLGLLVAAWLQFKKGPTLGI
eukprot:TRINITY_DN80518_c0_g1_i1.p1 TRINITY_DN80518_c0_g1~~TRINITY_DN80518_c0_g1_i1.p1  ORF type:complete len:115 (+),score=33.01 TRINITY_DN80518_c0_g1_i1:72-416(+)